MTETKITYMDPKALALTQPSKNNTVRGTRPEETTYAKISSELTQGLQESEEDPLPPPPPETDEGIMKQFCSNSFCNQFHIRRPTNWTEPEKVGEHVYTIEGVKWTDPERIQRYKVLKTENGYILKSNIKISGKTKETFLKEFEKKYTDQYRKCKCPRIIFSETNTRVGGKKQRSKKKNKNKKTVKSKQLKKKTSKKTNLRKKHKSNKKKTKK